MKPLILILRPVLIVFALVSPLSRVMAGPVSPEVVHDLAPSGVIRAAINFGNPVLAQKDAATGAPRGLSVTLAKALASRLGVPVTLVGFAEAGQVFAAAGSGQWDVAFLAIDPVRAAGIDFTAPYLVIEGGYLVTQDSPLKAIEDVDGPGIRIAAGKGSAYDLYLTRHLEHAKLVYASTSAGAPDLFIKDHLDAAAGIRTPLIEFAREHPGFRVLPGRFMAINQAMGVPKGRGAGYAFLREFVEEMKASGSIAEAIAASGHMDAAVAPPAPAK